MTKTELQKEILSLLPSSTIPQHDKNMLKILLPAMKESKLQNIYNALKSEHSRMSKLNEKKKRIELKYQVMVEGLTKSRK